MGRAESPPTQMIPVTRGKSSGGLSPRQRMHCFAGRVGGGGSIIRADDSAHIHLQAGEVADELVVEPRAGQDPAEVVIFSGVRRFGHVEMRANARGGGAEGLLPVPGVGVNG
jgi:hypothetical protein